MITAAGFSKKLLFVICLLIGLRLMYGIFPILFNYFPVTDYYIYLRFGSVALNASIGLVLAFQARMPLALLVGITILSAFYPTGAVIVYLMLTSLRQPDEL
jgi:hypothetical protein